MRRLPYASLSDKFLYRGFRMNIEESGTYIAAKRKEQNMTRKELA